MIKQSTAVRMNSLHLAVKSVFIMMKYSPFLLLKLYWPNVGMIPHRHIILEYYSDDRSFMEVRV